MDYVIKFADQLKQHLRALRRAKGLTQADLASRMGVGQSRIADVEANPGAISSDQLLKLLSILDVRLVLRDHPSSDKDSSLTELRTPGPARSGPPTGSIESVATPPKTRKPKGSW